MSEDILVRVDGVSKKYCRRFKRSLWYGLKDTAADLLARRNSACALRRDEFWAVDDVSFELRRGECFGLIGRNGSGKTTLLKMLNGLVKPDKGRVQMRGRVGALIALGAGFNPILTGRENIYVNGAILGLSKREIDARLDHIVDFAEIGEFIDAPVQSYSSGMAVRLGFAVASALEPDVLLLDEVLAVGDAAFRSKCWRRLGDLMASTAVILVSHEAYAIARLCDRALLLDRGRLVCEGPADEALSRYAEMQDEQPHDVDKLMQLDNLIESVRFVSSQEMVEPGGIYQFDVEIVAKDAVTIDYAVLNICDRQRDVHGQCPMEFPNRTLRKGTNRFSVQIGPLFLTKRRFYLVVMINTNGGKRPLIHSRAELWFEFKGNVSHGPKYYPPIRIKSTAPTLAAAT